MKMMATDEVNTRTAHRESEIGGLIKSQEEWGHTRYQDPNSWELRSGSWKRKNASGHDNRGPTAKGAIINRISDSGDMRIGPTEAD